LDDAVNLDALFSAIPGEQGEENDGEPVAPATLEAQVAEDRETDSESESPSGSGSDETGSLFEDDEGMDSCDVD
jgi:hypothetical protein